MVLCDISEFEGKAMLRWGVEQWLRSNDGLLQQYLDNEMSFDDREPFKEALFSDELQMMIMKKILQQYKPGSEEDNNRKFSMLLSEMAEKRGRLLLITGKRGSGKTAFTYRLAELLHRYFNEPIYYLGPPVPVPKFIAGTTANENNLPADCTVIVDEAGVQFMARKALENIDTIISKLPILRHTGRNMLFVTQSTAISDINIFRQADAVVFKSPAMFEFESERFRVDRQLAMFMPKSPEKALYLTNDKLLTMTFRLPEWWAEKYSKPYSPFKSKKELYMFVVRLLWDGLDFQQIIEQAGLRGTELTAPEIGQISEMANYYGYDTLLHQPENIVSYIDEGFDDTSLNDLAAGREKKIFGTKWEMDNRQRKETAKFEKQWLEQEKYAFKVNLNQWFLTDLKQASKNSNRTIAVMSALTEMRGIHKSNAAISLACLMQKIFNKGTMSVDRIAWDNDDVMNAVRNSKQGDVHIRDEHGFSVGVGSGRAQMELANLIESIRMERKNFIFCGVSYKREHAFDYILEPWGINRKLRLVKLLMLDKQLQPEGYITLSWTPAELWKQYEERKKDYLRKTVSREAVHKRRIQTAIQMLQDEHFPAEGTIKDKETYITDIAGIKVTAEEARKIVSLTGYDIDFLQQKLKD